MWLCGPSNPRASAHALGFDLKGSLCGRDKVLFRSLFFNLRARFSECDHFELFSAVRYFFKWAIELR